VLHHAFDPRQPVGQHNLGSSEQAEEMITGANKNFVQSDYVRDFVFPLAQAKQNSDGTLRFEGYCGTGFLIGNRGYALTALHVVQSLQAGCQLVALFASTEWRAFPVVAIEPHPAEDVAVIQIVGNWNSPFQMASSWEGASCDYQLWGYPEDALLSETNTALGAQIYSAPDLICFKGYIRRRITHHLSGLIGESFFELSQPAYCGCSGGPIWRHGPGKAWMVLGIYIGFRRAQDPSIPFLSVGYAVREDAFRNWKPDILRVSIEDEAAHGSLGRIK
jgi:hypothetical protein